MFSAAEALHLVLENKRDFGVEEVSLLQCCGRILAQNIFSDRDFPPFNRVMMDGIAISAAAFNNGTRAFTIEKIQAAGSPQQTLQYAGNCIEVMTGAVVPANTDAVVPYEQCEIAEGIATVSTNSLLPMQNVHLRGVDSKKGDLLIEKWKTITPAMIGIMASAGVSAVQVLKPPKVIICSTGDELVDVWEQPEAHQVRRSNVYMLAAALFAEGIHADTLHLPDNSKQMTAEIAALIVTSDVILFSGAVSKGKFDYLPSVLKDLGMQEVFHTIAQRPGKPFLFGTFANGPIIFGFPGNPISTFVCYHQFFKRWLHQCTHCERWKLRASLAVEVHFQPALTHHLLVSLSENNGVVIATPINTSGSGDLVSLTKADGIITLLPERTIFNEGEVFEVNLLF